MDAKMQTQQEAYNKDFLFYSIPLITCIQYLESASNVLGPVLPIGACGQSGVPIQHPLCKCWGGDHAKRGESLPSGTLQTGQLWGGQNVVGTRRVGSDWDFRAEL